MANILEPIKNTKNLKRLLTRLSHCGPHAARGFGTLAVV